MQLIRISFFLIILGLAPRANCQNPELRKQSIEEIKRFDFFNYDYKYLNDKFEIEIDTATYNKAIDKYRFRNWDRYKYQDSLKVILMLEFDNFDYARMGSLRLAYTWDRVGLYTYEKAERIKKIGIKNGLTRPYIFIDKLRDEDVKNSDLQKIINNLKQKLSQKYPEDSINSFKNKELLKFAFNNNPKVHALKAEAIKKRNIRNFVKKHKRQPTEKEMTHLGVGCGKENCCQTKEN